MTASNDAPPVPERVVDPAAARPRHGDRVDFLLRMLQVGDPLADAVITEFDELGRPARTALHRGLTEGRASVPDAAPAVDALLAHVETMPGWVSPELLDQGDRTSLAVPAHWSRLAFAGTCSTRWCVTTTARTPRPRSASRRHL